MTRHPSVGTRLRLPSSFVLNPRSLIPGEFRKVNEDRFLSEGYFSVSENGLDQPNVKYLLSSGVWKANKPWSEVKAEIMCSMTISDTEKDFFKGFLLFYEKHAKFIIGH
jgi:hypothetical protein